MGLKIFGRGMSFAKSRFELPDDEPSPPPWAWAAFTLAAACAAWVAGLCSLDQRLGQLDRRSSSQARIRAIHLSPFSSPRASSKKMR